MKTKNGFATKASLASLFSFLLILTSCRSSPYGGGYGGGGFGFTPGQRIGQFILFAIVGALLGAFWSERAKPFRKYLWWILGAVIALYCIFYVPPMADLIAFIAGFVVAFIALKLPKILGSGRRQKATTFGSAEWATLEHLQEAGLLGDKGLFLGLYPYAVNNQFHLSPVHYYTKNAADPNDQGKVGDRHLLTVAPTRAGKGVSTIIPNLLMYEGSALVIDPKGENARITSVRRGAGNSALQIPGMGQQVHVVDPWELTGLPVSQFNPMEWLDPRDQDISENAMMLADALVTPHQNSNAFFDEESKALLMGLILYVALDEAEQGDRTLGRVRDIIVLMESEFNKILERMMANPNLVVQSTAARTASKDSELRSNVMASLQSHTHFLDSPRIRENLSRSDFKFEDLKTSPMTVYLVLPADRLQPFGRWLRLLVQQAITVNARNLDKKPAKPILFMLDEMAALGRLSMVEQAFGLMAGFGMQLWGIVQDLSQLERIYGTGWETFIGNSGVLQYYGSRDHKTAEYFSKLCGVSTIEKASITRAISRAFSAQGSSSSTSDSSTIDVIQRQLAFPDELMVMRKNQALLLVESYNPIWGNKVEWFRDQKLKQLGTPLKDLSAQIPSGRRLSA